MKIDGPSSPKNEKSTVLFSCLACLGQLSWACQPHCGMGAREREREQNVSRQIICHGIYLH